MPGKNKNQQINKYVTKNLNNWFMTNMKGHQTWLGRPLLGLILIVMSGTHEVTRLTRYTPVEICTYTYK